MCPTYIHYNRFLVNFRVSSKSHKLPRCNSSSSSTNAQKAARKTMGYPEVQLQPPENYLKINGGVQRNRVAKDHECIRREMPPIPKKNDAKKPEIKNFKAVNIKNVCNMMPKRTAPRFVDTKTGDFHDLRKSGLMPAYIYQPKFGKLPTYLINRIREAGRQEEMYRDQVAGSNQPLCRYVTQEERSELLGVSWQFISLAVVRSPVYFLHLFLNNGQSYWRSNTLLLKV